MLRCGHPLTYSRNTGSLSFALQAIYMYVGASLSSQISHFNTLLFSIDIDFTELDRLNVLLSSKGPGISIESSAIPPIILCQVCYNNCINNLRTNRQWVHLGYKCTLSFLFRLTLLILQETKELLVSNQIDTPILPLTWCFFIVSTLVAYLLLIFAKRVIESLSWGLYLFELYQHYYLNDSL